MPAPEFLRSGELELATYRWPCRRSDSRSAIQTVLLVHGYPDSAAVWLPVAERLAEHFEVVAYDVRGSGHSGAPLKTRDYAIPRLMEDLEVVVEGLGLSTPLHLVAHDWGSVASWEAVTTAPLRNRFASYTTMSGPSLDHIGYWMRKRFEHRDAKSRRELLTQLVSSWYVFFFHIPVIAPRAWTLGFDRLWPRLVARMEGTQLPPDEHLVKDGKHGINLYRANVFARLSNPGERYTALPVQLILPLQDPFVSEALLDDLQEWAPSLTRVEIDAGHWAQVSHPDVVAGCVRSFIEGLECKSASRPSSLATGA